MLVIRNFVMIKALKIISILLLLFNGIGAIYGGSILIIDPTGAKMQLSLSYLEHSPFNNYFIPGLVLFVCNGLFSLFIIIPTIFNWPYYSNLISIQGLVLIAWIIIQVIMIRIVSTFHFLLGGIAILLFLLGLLLQVNIRRKLHFENLNKIN